MLTPCEDWAVRQGYISNPFVKPRPTKPTVWVPVDYSDGSRRRFRTLEEARAHLADQGAIRLWNPQAKKYETAA